MEELYELVDHESGPIIPDPEEKKKKEVDDKWRREQNQRMYICELGRKARKTIEATAAHQHVNDTVCTTAVEMRLPYREPLGPNDRPNDTWARERPTLERRDIERYLDSLRRVKVHKVKELSQSERAKYKKEEPHEPSSTKYIVDSYWKRCTTAFSILG